MAKAATRIKNNAALHPVPQSRDEVNDAIAKVGIAQRERAARYANQGDARKFHGTAWATVSMVDLEAHHA